MATSSKNSISKKLLAELQEYQKQPGITEKHTELLRNAILASPLLAAQITESLTRRNSKGEVLLEGFRTETDKNSGGNFSFQTRLLSVRSDRLINGEQSEEDTTFILGHEIKHCFDQERMNKLFENLKNNLEVQIRQKGQRDYTDEIKTFLQVSRELEARAEINGFNALVSAWKQKHNGSIPTKEQLFALTDYMHDFIERNRDKNGNVTYRFKAGLSIDEKTMELKQTPQNLEAMGKHYFDTQPIMGRGFGPKSNASYREWYSYKVIAAIIQQEQIQHGNNKVQLDLEACGIRPQILQDLEVDINCIEKPSIKNGKSNTVAITPSSSHTAALIAKYQAAAAAMDADSPNAATEMARSNPTVQKIMERFDAELERRQSLREFENSRYTLENMPERARDLHAQITDKLTAYVKENNLPYTKEGLQNSITALTAEAFDQKMTQVDHIGIHNDKLAVHQNGRFIHDFAEVDAFQSRLTPERDSFHNIVQAEQKHEQEAQQRETERQMEQSRGMGMSR